MQHHRWGPESLAALDTIDAGLRACCDDVLARSRCDLLAREGRRDRATQERYFAAGLTRARWGASEHNAEPPELARAIHLIPVPLPKKADGTVDWKDTDWIYHCVRTSALMDDAARARGLEIVWGGWWPSLRDLCHFELGG